jgi:hypothetical protein
LLVAFPFLINNKMKITIKEKEYSIKYTLRALFIYEQITGKTFKMQTMTDEYIFIYSLLLANAPDIDLSFEDFITVCDENPEIVVRMQMFIAKEMDKQAVFIKDATDECSKKKK